MWSHSIVHLAGRPKSRVMTGILCRSCMTQAHIHGKVTVQTPGQLQQQ